MLRSSESRPRRLSERHGLVVTEVRCGGSGAAAVTSGAAVRGGDESGVKASGVEGVEVESLAVCGTAGSAGATGCSMWLRAAAWYSDHVRGRVTLMGSVRRM